MSTKEPATAVGLDPKTTGVGSVFVSNYPPYSFWDRDRAGDIAKAVELEPVAETPLGIYAHIPFCRRRCKFCYFRVFVDKNAADVQRYVDALKREIENYAEQPLIAGRLPKFGGTAPVAQMRMRDENVRERGWIKTGPPYVFQNGCDTQAGTRIDQR